MAKSIKPANLGAALVEELTVYRADVMDKVNEAGEKAAKALVKKTKAIAPKDRGDFKRSITYVEKKNAAGDKTYTWGAKPPGSRLTHLLVNGHATKDGGRTKPNPFLQNALNEVLPQYEKDVKEAIKG